MADRVVILGPIREMPTRRIVDLPMGDTVAPVNIARDETERVVLAASITPMDGEAFVQSGQWRVSLARYSGALSDATVIRRVKEWRADADERSARSRAEDADWASALRICPEANFFVVPVPIPLAA